MERESLLAIGIVDVQGEFTKGDVVAVRDWAGVEFARGLSNYSAAEVLRIKGMKTKPLPRWGTVRIKRSYTATIWR